MSEWIESEFGSTDLGDARRGARLRTILTRMWQSPLASISSACRGFAEVMAASRFFNNEAVTQEAILEPHRDATVERLRAHERVLLVQDTTECDFTAKKALAGSGPLSNLNRRGFFAHNELVISDTRVPLGVWDTTIYAREDQEYGKANKRKQKPIEQKESYRWLEGYRHACDLAALAPDCQIISCADREADIYEIFVEFEQRRDRGEPAAQWLIRSKHDRCLKPFEEESKQTINQRIAQSPVLGTVTFRVPTREQNPKVKGVRKKTLRSGREVTLELRAMQVTLKAPFRSKRQGGKLPPVQITVLEARELAPPEGETPILWTLLTSLEVTTFEQACEVLELYSARWEIEVFHKVLKSGCRIEDIQLRTGERMKRAILLFMIVAWRVMYVMKLGRECPDLPCDVVFDEDEWQSVCVVLDGREAIARKPGLREMVRKVATLGGFLGRKCDGDPGAKSMWIGLMRTADFAICWQRFGKPPEPTG